MFDELFWQAFIFSAIAISFVAISAWWLYLSPLKNAARATIAASPRVAVIIAVLLGLSLLQLVGGALWDASMHIQTGQIPGGADFLWPPHLFLYSGFLVSFLVALIAVGLIAGRGWRTGSRDPRAWVRANPYVGAVALTSMYGLSSIPGDAIWHQLYGPDLTAWSPPHLLLVATMATQSISALGLLMNLRVAPEKIAWRNVGALILLGLGLNLLYIVGVVEWELPAINAMNQIVATRPLWFYPLVGGALAFFTVALARRVVPWRWAATGAALAFFAIRVLITIGLGVTDNIVPAIPLMFILGAVLVDAISVDAIASPRARDLAFAALFVAGYFVLAIPLIGARRDLFAPTDFVWAIVSLLILGIILLPITRAAAARLAPNNN
ncbi:MAG: hypothetical protein HY070_06940 [Chloroflexi bacterium]|nr:hypothetical protein [Chloroflexota bacterium]